MSPDFDNSGDTNREPSHSCNISECHQTLTSLVTPTEYTIKMSSVVNIEEYQGVSARALNVSIRTFLATMLDKGETLATSRHVLRNWMGLGELLGYNYEQINNFENDGKTKMLLHDYSMGGGDVAKLLQSLQELERYDILEDAIFQQSLRKDVASFLSNQRQQTTQRPQEQVSVQDPEVTSAGHHDDIVDYGDDEIALTKQDSLTGTTTMYDAYIVYADEDFRFVEEMITQLEIKYGLRLCISNRDMLAGSAQFEAIAALIRKRCSKVVVVMSPAFKRSRMCTFATNFAFSLCPSTLRGILVPILYLPCQIPDMLRYIAPLDFTKVEYIQWFWERLLHSLKPTHITPVPGTRREQPPPYEESDMTINDVRGISCDAGSSTRDPDDAMAETDRAIGGVPVSAAFPSPPSKMEITSGTVALPINSGKRKKPWFRIKPKTHRRHAHTNSLASTSEPAQ